MSWTDTSLSRPSWAARPNVLSGEFLDAAHHPVSQRYVLPSGAMPTRQCLIAHSCIACCLNLGNIGVKLILCVCWIVLGSLCFKGMEKYHRLNK